MDTSSITIRSVTGNTALGSIKPPLTRLYRGVFKLPPFCFELTEEEIERMFQEHPLREGFQCLVAEDHSSVLRGFVWAFQTAITPKLIELINPPWSGQFATALSEDPRVRGKKFLHIEALAVDPAMQGHGLGQRLIEALTHGHGAVSVALLEDSPTAKLLVRVGFTLQVAGSLEPRSDSSRYSLFVATREGCRR